MTGRVRTRVGAGGEAFERLSEGQWPSAGVVTAVCGSWPAARAAALASETTV
jgi:hypothetical protein